MSLYFEKLSVFKDRLLDLSARNKLLNSNFKARTLSHFRIIDELPDMLNEKLSISSMSFQSLPKMPSEPPDERSTKFQNAVDEARYLDEEYQQELQRNEEQGADDMNEAAEVALRKLKDRVRAELGMPKRSKIKHSILTLKEHAEKHDINPEFDLPQLDKGSDAQEKWSDRKIQTLMLPDTLKRYIRNINRAYNSSLKETGVNPLYFCFGFLEWKESESSDHKRYSPILMLQVDFAKNKRGGGFRVKGTGDTIFANHNLNEKLKKDFNCELPIIDEIEDEEHDFSIEEYLIKVKEEVADPNNWKIKRWVSFGIYNTQNMPIYKDLEKIIESEPTNLLKELIEGKEISSIENPENYEVDNEKYKELIPALVREADESQFSAIIDVLEERNLVIKGPPGTGKSQTITNIISTLMAKGKKVLFVAQKQAALDVVRNNLEAAGLSKYLLEIFSIKANKKAVYNSIKERVEMDDPIDAYFFESTIKGYNATKEKLNEYASLMGSDLGETGLTIHEILWDIPKLDFEVPSELHIIEPNDAELINESSLRKYREWLRHLRDTYYKLFSVDDFFNHPIRNIKKRVTDIYEIKDLKEQFLLLKGELDKCFNQQKRLREQNRAIIEISDEELKSNSIINKWVQLNQNPSSERDTYWEVLKVVLNPASTPKVARYITTKQKLEEDEIKYQKTSEEMTSIFDLENSLYDIDEIKSAAKILKETNLFSYFSPTWYKSQSIFKQLYLNTYKNTTAVKGKLLERLFKYNSTKDSFEKQLSETRDELRDLTEEICNLNELSSLDLINNFSKEEIVEIIDATKNLGENFRSAWIDNPDSINELFDFNEKKTDLLERINKLFDSLEVVKDQVFPDDSNEDSTLEVLGEFFSSITSTEIDLSNYMDWLSAENNIEDGLVNTFYESYSNSELSMSDIHNVFKFIVRTSQQRKIQQKYSKTLSRYSPNYLDKLRSDLQSLDKEVRSLYKKIFLKRFIPISTRLLPVYQKGK